MAKITLSKTPRAQALNGNGESKKDKPARPPLVDSFKGKPILVLNPDSNWPFQFGIGKAKLILKHIEHIKAFAAEYENHDDVN